MGGGGTCDLVFRSFNAGTDDAEVQANRFAGALLVPRDALLADSEVQSADSSTEWSDLQLERLSRRFRVSREVILRRLLTLERTNETIYRAHRAALLAIPGQVRGAKSGRPAVAVMA